MNLGEEEIIQGRVAVSSMVGCLFSLSDPEKDWPPYVTWDGL